MSKYSTSISKTALTHYYRLGSLKPLKCVLSQFWGWKSEPRVFTEAATEGSGGVLPVSQIFLGSRKCGPHLCLCLPVASVPASMSSLLIRTLVIDLGFTHLLDDLLSRPLLTSAKTPFPNKVVFAGSRGQALDICFWGPLFSVTQRN